MTPTTQHMELQYNTDYEACLLTLRVPHGSLELFKAAVEARQLRGLWPCDEDPEIWFSAGTSEGVISVSREHNTYDELRISMQVHTHNPADCDHTKCCNRTYLSHAPEWQWHEFVKPLRQILPVLGITSRTVLS